ncbi:hypothetical protein MTO96_012883 [Rhipicephalus appendiculatus]
MAHEYVDAVTRRLRCDLTLHGVGTTEIRNMEGQTGWLLHNATIRGLDHIVHDGVPWPIKAPNREIGPPSPQRYDVAAVMLIEDLEFEAFYEDSHADAISGKVSGKVEERTSKRRANTWTPSCGAFAATCSCKALGRPPLQSLDDDHTAWDLHSGKIYGLDQISHDGRPWPVKTPSDDSDVDDDSSPQRFDVAAVVLLHDICFEATYNYESPKQTVSGEVSGKIAVVRLDMIIGRKYPTELVLYYYVQCSFDAETPRQQMAFPKVTLFEVTEYTRVGLSKKSVGVLNEKILNDATEKVVHTCIEDAMTYRVLPVLNNLLKAIPYPKFTQCAAVK